MSFAEAGSGVYPADKSGGRADMNEVPTHVEMAWPTLQVLEQHGGSASRREIDAGIAEILNLSDEVLEQLQGSGPMLKVDYRASWTRTYLKKMGVIANSRHGVWSLTDDGRQIDSETDFAGRFREIAREASKRSRSKAAATEPAPDSLSVGDRQDDLPVDPDEEDTWQDTLLATLRAMQPDGFERLCQRVLREHGFTEVEVTGRSGDGGIDGKGVLRIGLVSFPVVFQCKRYEGAVGADKIRDFRGALPGLTTKGLFLTTGRFSGSAQDEAIRPGVPAIDLIDGLELCDLLKERDLGVRTEMEMVEQVSVDPAFFEQFERG